MNIPLKHLSALSFIVTASSVAAEGPKPKVLDKFDSVDPKTTKAYELKVKSVTTTDPLHRKALELVADFNKPGAYPHFDKLLPAGTFNPKRYSGIRFHAKTENETKMHVHIWSDAPGPDGRPMDCIARVPLTNSWSEVVIPFSDFKYYEVKTFKNGAQKIYPGGESIAEADLAQIKVFGFVFSIEGRGTDTLGRVLVDGLELVEK